MTLLLAPAKLNLGLFVGPTRDDGLHEIASVFEPLALADELRVSAAEAGSADEVSCPAVGGPNLVERALELIAEKAGKSGRKPAKKPAAKAEKAPAKKASAKKTAAKKPAATKKAGARNAE